MACDVGTHIDSPSHWFVGARDVSQLTVDELTCNGVVIDCREKAAKDSDYRLTIDDLLAWEERHGAMPKRALVCMKTGWSLKFKTHREYMGLDDKQQCHFPGFSAELAKFLLERRDIVGIGIDTGSLDFGLSSDYPVHNLILGADKYQVMSTRKRV